MMGFLFVGVFDKQLGQTTTTTSTRTPQAWMGNKDHASTDLEVLHGQTAECFKFGDVDVPLLIRARLCCSMFR